MGWVRLHIPVGWAGSQGSDTQHCSLCADCSPGALRGLPSVLCPPTPVFPAALRGEAHSSHVLQTRQPNSERASHLPWTDGETFLGKTACKGW